MIYLFISYYLMLLFLSFSGSITAIYVTKEEQNGVINHSSPAPAVGTLGFQSPTGKNTIYIEYPPPPLVYCYTY